LTTGAQSEVYADHSIANHLKAIGEGKTYAQLSAEAQANPTDAKLAGTVALMLVLGALGFVHSRRNPATEIFAALAPAKAVPVA
jgi:hypothetical protein